LKDPEASKAILDDFLTPALEKRIFKPAPKGEVVGRGLEFVQKAVDLIGEGVSAKKLVVEIP
jgi:hypothetical protein